MKMTSVPDQHVAPDLELKIVQIIQMRLKVLLPQWIAAALLVY